MKRGDCHTFPGDPEAEDIGPPPAPVPSITHSSISDHQELKGIASMLESDGHEV